jgi:hypothetical protein
MKRAAPRLCLVLPLVCLLLGCREGELRRSSNTGDHGQATDTNGGSEGGSAADTTGGSAADSAPGTDTPSATDTAPAADSAPGPETADRCEGLSCVATCVTDEDCAAGGLCVVYEDGCCSMCGQRCDEACYLQEGDYCPGEPPSDQCEIGAITVKELSQCWFELSYEGQDGVDTIVQNGCWDFTDNLKKNACGIQLDAQTETLKVACNWCGQVPYTRGACDCEPSCEGKTCGPDGCGGQCGVCDAGCACSSAGQCMGCNDAPVKLKPLCVHAPSMVGAGQPFPVAIYGELGCSTFDRVEVTATPWGRTFEYEITVWGKDSLTGVCQPYEVCELQSWIFSGLVWLEAPNPGPYKVKVGDSFTVDVGASGGLISEPACQDDCAEPLLEDWDWTLGRITSQDVTGECFSTGSPGFQGEPVTFDGTCQDYSIQVTGWSFPEKLKHCTDGRVLFGDAAPYWTEATVCPGNPNRQPQQQILLGIAQGTSSAGNGAAMFVIDGASGAVPR